jgi:hypothetical protein
MRVSILSIPALFFSLGLILLVAAPQTFGSGALLLAGAGADAVHPGPPSRDGALGSGKRGHRRVGVGAPQRRCGFNDAGAAGTTGFTEKAMRPQDALPAVS